MLVQATACQLFHYTVLHLSFVQLDANLGVSTDNQTTPPLPKYLPPVLIFLPWVLSACSLPPDYLSGRTVAIQLLCEMNIRHVRTQPSLQQLTLFYQLLQRSLQPTSVSTHSPQASTTCPSLNNEPSLCTVSLPASLLSVHCI